MLELKNCQVRWDKENYIPKKVSDFTTEPQTGTPQEIGERFLEENLVPLKLPALENLRFERTVKSLAATTVLFQQYFEGTPIHGAWVTLHLDQQNRIFLVKNDTVPMGKLQEKIAKIQKQGRDLPAEEIDRIIHKKAEEYGTLDTEIQKESMIYTLKGQYKKVWKVKFGTKEPVASWILFIDKSNGHLIEERNVLWKADGKGWVFKPNPVVSLNRDDLVDLKDQDQDVLKPAYKIVVLKELDPGGYLKGPYVDTGKTKNRAQAADNKFMFTRKDDRFEEVMAYYHIDTAQRYLQSLGFNNETAILKRPIKVNAHGGSQDNSFYDPSPSKHDLTFGNGGVDDAEDAEIIFHEYGHAIQDAIIPGWGQADEGRAMGEGFGDYWAASYFDQYKKGDRKLKIGEWDAKGYTSGDRICLRRLDSKKRYPADMEGEEHVDGEIWSACLWQVRKLLGRKKADTVILESHFYLGQYSDFKDGAEAIITAEKNLYGGKRTKSLTKIFTERGILSK